MWQIIRYSREHLDHSEELVLSNGSAMLCPNSLGGTCNATSVEFQEFNGQHSAL
jgi:hypothetical protein